jgi:hypothetical protein
MSSRGLRHRWWGVLRFDATNEQAVADIEASVRAFVASRKSRLGRADGHDLWLIDVVGRAFVDNGGVSGGEDVLEPVCIRP